MRMSSTTNAMTTLASKFLLNCQPDTQVTVELISGSLSPGPTAQERSLVSFTAFHYNRTNAAAWSVYRESNWTVGAGGINPFTFGDDVLTVGGVTWSRTTNEVVISEYGNYYVYVSGATQPNRAFGLTVHRNGAGVFGVYRTSSIYNGIDSLGHGLVMILNAGDRLKVVADANSAGYSIEDRRHASFFGFLVV